MYFLHVQAPPANQFSAEQQHRNLVPEACACGRIAVDIDHFDGVAACRRQRCEFRQQLLAQAAARARVEQKAHDERGYGCGRSPLKDLTECAMNSTVCAGTSPTAVTWWPCTTVEKANPEPTRANPCIG